MLGKLSSIQQRGLHIPGHAQGQAGQDLQHSAPVEGVPVMVLKVPPYPNPSGIVIPPQFQLSTAAQGENLMFHNIHSCLLC